MQNVEEEEKVEIGEDRKEKWRENIDVFSQTLIF